MYVFKAIIILMCDFVSPNAFVIEKAELYE